MLWSQKGPGGIIRKVLQTNKEPKENQPVSLDWGGKTISKSRMKMAAIIRTPTQSNCIHWNQIVLYLKHSEVVLLVEENGDNTDTRTVPMPIQIPRSSPCLIFEVSTILFPLSTYDFLGKDNISSIL